MFPGYQSQVFYNTDVPAMTSQFPQILSKSGTEYLYLSRSWNFDNAKQNEFLRWISPDGTKIKTHFMHHYGDNVWEDKTVAYVAKRIPDYNYHDPILLIAMDCTPPNDLSGLLADWEAYRNFKENRDKNLPPMEYRTYQKAVESIFKKNEFPFMLQGEWPNKWIYENDGSDYNTFLHQKEAQRKLSMAETLGVMLALLRHSFAEYESGSFEKAWRDAVRACHGYAPEKPIEAFRKCYKQAHTMAEDLLQKYAQKLADGIAAKAAGIPVCVFHFGAKAAEQVVRLAIPEELQGDNVEAVLSDGTVCDAQRADAELLVKMSLPAVGFTTVYLRKADPSPATWESDTCFENAYYRLELHANGIGSLWDKEQKKELFANGKFTAGEILVMDYDGMGAGEHINIWQPNPKNFKRLMTEQLCWKLVNAGAVCNVYEAVLHGEEATVTLRVTAYRSIKKVDLDVDITDLKIADHKQMRIMFPMSTGKVVYEVPFGEVTVGEDEVLKKFARFNPNKGNHNDTNHEDNTGVRPREVQNYISCTDETGFETMISSYNLPWDYQDPTEDPLETPVLQPILLSTSKACHWLYGCWSQNDDRHYHFSILSGKGEHSSMAAKATAENGNIWSAISAATGSLFDTDTYSMLNMDSDIIGITAIKKAEDDQKGIVVRLVNKSNHTTAGKLSVNESIKEYTMTDLIERPIGESISVEDHTMNLSPGAWEIAEYYLCADDMQESKAAPDGLIAAIKRNEEETLHSVDLSWFPQDEASQYEVYYRESGAETWSLAATTHHNQAKLMLPDGEYELGVKCTDSVMSCPITILIRKAPEITL